MAEIKVPEDLPNCELLDILADKINLRRDINFDFFGNLENFRKRVSNEMLQVNVLFPEYTPHDEQYHLKRLFHVADTILGKERFEAMNSAELFILAVALYGHDWGMAVSDQEKQYILTNELPKGMTKEDFWILPDEHTHLVQFAHKQRLAINAEGRLENIPIEMWREYVRETHAHRSSERVNKFFSSIDGGIAEAASRVCAGHWLDFEILQDYCLYPSDFSVLRETVNLRALAVYLRLIDLLDLAEDRTPYVIWKFVAPRDPRSKMEWIKHRALRPVTCAPYQTGRIIRVDGSTDDHEVYAALEDFRIWCEQQLRGCNDVLSRMNDVRHKLDIYHIDWRVAARGFKPLSIQFEFDRERMFEILSDEIYNGDPYVFLRELLQNSIDAIRMRREVLKSNGIEPKNLGAIYVDVKHGNNGDAVITWRDDGIGMDEYIIRNYLSIAGKSYYHSSDFERLGLKMDSISKFGIGILSCFVAAERIEIETFKDPYLPPRSERLRLIIPAINRQFRIETLPQEGAAVGTTIKLFVEGRKISLDDTSKSVKPLEVTDYLSIVAGFVEFPIIITEGDRKTIVLHPKQDAEAACKRFGKEFKVHQLDINYPWSQAFLSQDLSNAHEVLREERMDIASDFKLEGYEGFFNCIVPIDDSIDLFESYSGSIGILSKGKDIQKKVRINESWTDYSKSEYLGLSPSSMHSTAYTVYRDGILLSAVSEPRFLINTKNTLPVPQLVVNLPKTTYQKIDLARSKIIWQSESWDGVIYNAYQNYILKKSLNTLIELDPTKRLYHIGRLIAFYNIQFDNLLEIFPRKNFPLSFLEADGNLNILEWQTVANDVLYGPPESVDIYSFINPHIRTTFNNINSEISLFNKHLWLTCDKYNGLFTHWIGERCLFFQTNYESTSISIRVIEKLELFFIKKFYRFQAIRFLHPPWKEYPPILQKIWVLKEAFEGEIEISTVLEKAAENPTLLNHEERELLMDYEEDTSKYRRKLPEFVDFPKPFERNFIYGEIMLNMKHPVTLLYLRFVTSLILSKIQRNLPEDRIGYLEDALVKFNSFIYEQFDNKDDLDSLDEVLSLVRETQLFDIDDTDIFLLMPTDFIKMPSFKITEMDMKPEKVLEMLGEIQPFGMPL